MSQELLENRWSETKEALLEGLQGTRRSTMGVILENTRKHLAENATAGRSRVQDADFAVESANLAKNQVLQQAGMSVLAQANALPQQVLALLQ